MKRIVVLFLAFSLLLCGCASIFDGSYVSTQPNQVQGSLIDIGDIQAATYDELLSAVISLAERGAKSGIIYVPMYDPERVAADMERAARFALLKSPIAAYAVQEITWELGTNNGQRAAAVNITYIHDRAEILKIRTVQNMEQAAQMIYQELGDSSTGIVLYVVDYNKTDFVQMVEEYAFRNPQLVMETPQVVANIYPNTGASRVVELKFTYQNTREALRQMKNQVLPVYASATYRISEENSIMENFSRLYSFLMDRGFGEYTIETSNTPAYSLLWHGAGDSRAFATLYAAICRYVDLDCEVVTGTRNGEPWYWNLIKIEEAYYHLDLLRSYEDGGFSLRVDQEMNGYVWDYSAYPATPEEVDPSLQETQPLPTAPEEQ